MTAGMRLSPYPEREPFNETEPVVVAVCPCGRRTPAFRLDRPGHVRLIEEFETLHLCKETP